MRARHFAVFAALVIGAGSLAAPASASTNLSARQVAAKLAPLGCRAVKDTSTVIGIKPLQALVCTIRGESIAIDQYRTRAQLSLTVTLARNMGCQIAKQMGLGGSFPFVRGTTTEVSAQTVATARLIQRAIGNGFTLGVVRC